MIILKSNHSNSTPVNKDILFNKDLSAEARIILLILLTHSEDYSVNQCSLSNESGLSLYKLRNAMKELSSAGFLSHMQTTKNGRYSGVEWTVKDDPKLSRKSNDTSGTYEQPKVLSPYEYQFQQIWEEYPIHRRGSRKEAISVFEMLVSSEALDINYEDILLGLNEMKHSKNWTKDNGKWIPSLKKFLDNRGWIEGIEHPSTLEARMQRIDKVLEGINHENNTRNI